MSAATQIYYASFDAVFLKLPGTLRVRIEREIDDIGARLASYPHHRLKGSNRYRARVGDYRIIYTFELPQFTFLPSGIDARFTATSNESRPPSSDF